jgi:hypothetical protein
MLSLSKPERRRPSVSSRALSSATLGFELDDLQVTQSTNTTVTHDYSAKELWDHLKTE